jgi:hypothetical protein
MGHASPSPRLKFSAQFLFQPLQSILVPVEQDVKPVSQWF